MILNRFLSLLVAVGYVLAVYLHTESHERTFRMCIGLVFPSLVFGSGNNSGTIRAL